MNIANIILIVILLIVIFWIVMRIFIVTDIIYDILCIANKPIARDSITRGASPSLSSVFTANPNIVLAKDVGENNTHNFMLSVWFYIDSWTTTTKEKNIIFLATKYDLATNPDLQTRMSGMSIKAPCGVSKFKNLNIALDKYENNLFIDIETIAESGTCISGSTFTRYIIKNIDVQKWVNITLSVDTRLMDVYLDGKLRNSFILNGVYKNKYDSSTSDHRSPNYKLENNLYIGSVDTNNSPGFEGFVTRIRYQSHSINPQEAYNIYRKGVSATAAKALYNQYRVKVSLLEYDKERGSVTI